jgi:DNA helicase II / ATP-dependent DNA helicase PcrA
MAAQIAKLIGGAGTGKTTELMRILGQIIDTGIDPMEVGFVSFTRAARAEAAGRVEDQFGVPSKQLQERGWFRTLHSVCYQALGGGRSFKPILDNKESRQWVSEAIGEEISGASITDEQDISPEPNKGAKNSTVADHALQLWSISRNRLVSLAEENERQIQLGSLKWDLGEIKDIVRKYEQAKYLDDRLDFADMAGRFAGWRWNVDDEPAPCNDEGDCPHLPVWFFDEHQDVSQLLHSVSVRLVESPECRWAYYAGDPFQALYGFAGSDHRCFLEAIEADKIRTMDRSYRCPAGVLELGEDVLRRCSDYFDRGIKPNSSDHGVDHRHSFQNILTDIESSDQTWLLIARTNYLSTRFRKGLKRSGIPWDYTRGAGGYCTPTSRATCKALTDLHDGKTIEANDWRLVLRNIKSGSSDDRLIDSGVKTRLAAGDYPILDDDLSLHQITDYGATERFRSIIERSQWVPYVAGGEEFSEACLRYGVETAVNPRVRVGTIHSVKGSEADNVVLLTSITSKCEEGRKSIEGQDAEHRVAYVGVTRARKRLLVLNQQRDRWRMDL